MRSGELSRLAPLVVLVALVLGVLQGLLWALLAPGAQYKIYTDGTFQALPTESLNNFTDFAIFALIGLSVGLIGSYICWQFRSARGLPMLMVVGVSALLGSAQAGLVAYFAAAGTLPSSVGAQAAESIVTAPPVLVGWPMILAQPAAAVLIYTFLVAWNGLPDLGRVGELAV